MVSRTFDILSSFVPAVATIADSFLPFPPLTPLRDVRLPTFAAHIDVLTIEAIQKRAYSLYNLGGNTGTLQRNIEYQGESRQGKKPPALWIGKVRASYR